MEEKTSILEEHINVSLKGTNLELTEAIYDYVVKRVTNLGKILGKINEEVHVFFDVGLLTNHHKKGDIFYATGLVKIGGQEFYYSANNENLYAAIDEVKEKLFREIRQNKTKKQTLFRQGATKIKSLFKGITKWK